MKDQHRVHQAPDRGHSVSLGPPVGTAWRRGAASMILQNEW